MPMKRFVRAQCLYVNERTGEMGTFDSWQRWPEVGFFKSSAGAFMVLYLTGMREATEAEIQMFARAKRSGMEATASVRAA